MDNKLSTSDKMQIVQLLEIIDECDKNIAHLLHEMGRGEDSFSVKQERYFKNKYTEELNEILKSFHLKVKFIESDEPLPKAA
jgi:hypothetical protein